MCVPLCVCLFVCVCMGGVGGNLLECWGCTGEASLRRRGLQQVICERELGLHGEPSLPQSFKLRNICVLAVNLGWTLERRSGICRVSVCRVGIHLTWPRKKSTPWTVSASWIEHASAASPVGRARSTPVITAPMVGVCMLTWTCRRADDHPA